MAEARRTFGPVALVGLASAGLAAVAGNRAWVRWSGHNESQLSSLTIGGDSSATVPLAGALALVVLACWGVLLVTRGRFRRGVAGLAALGSLGLVLTGLLGHGSATGGLRDSLSEVGIDDLTTATTSWYWIFLACAAVSVLATAAAVRFVPSWPAMGSRYDAPGATPPPGDETSLDLWRAMDDGRDPTLPPERAGDP
jgi:uncharacterized membrane protein (TIGR02234 family)